MGHCGQPLSDRNKSRFSLANRDMWSTFYRYHSIGEPLVNIFPLYASLFKSDVEILSLKMILSEFQQTPYAV